MATLNVADDIYGGKKNSSEWSDETMASTLDSYVNREFYLLFEHNAISDETLTFVHF